MRHPTTNTGPSRRLRPWRLLGLALAGLGCMLRAQAAAPEPTAEELQALADDVYLYAYPLLAQELRRRVDTNVDVARPGGMSPVNQWSHVTAPPTAGTPRAQPYALRSSLWFDVAKEPLVISLPAPGERQYLLDVFDLWGDLIAAAGPRTSGRGAVALAIVGPQWKGRLPANVLEVRSTTANGRVSLQLPSKTRTDSEALAAFQKRVTAVPLSRVGRVWVPPPGVVDPLRDMSTPPLTQLEKLPGASWLSLLAELTALNPPQGTDGSVLLQLRRLGLELGKPVDLTLVNPAVVTALTAAPARVLPRVQKAVGTLGTPINGWSVLRSPLGAYGSDYLRRAAVVREDLNLSLPQDLLQASVATDGEGHAFDADARYQIHFTREQLPVAQALWSLALYDAKQRLVENPENRYSLGSRDALKYNADGTLDLLVQRDEPESGQDNWLPSPTAGAFSLVLRWYWPLEARAANSTGPETQDGGWKPPSVQKLR